MLKFVILLSIAYCALGVPKLPMQSRIVGGVDTTVQKFPYQVSVQHNGSHTCGGSIYNKKTIVTAAHCLQGVTAKQLKVRAGSTRWNSGGFLVEVAKFRKHEGYNANTMVNDIALIHLKSPLNMSSSVRAIDLPGSRTSTGKTAVVSGWGTTSSGAYKIPDALKKVDVEIVTRQDCASSKYGYGNQIKSNMLCAYTPGKDSCQGDSGGPLVMNNILIGIVSWGYGCADAHYPGVYTDVSQYRQWVLDVAKTL